MSSCNAKSFSGDGSFATVRQCILPHINTVDYCLGWLCVHEWPVLNGVEMSHLHLRWLL